MNYRYVGSKKNGENAAYAHLRKGRIRVEFDLERIAILALADARILAPEDARNEEAR